MINAIQIALSGLTAASRKVEAGASNIANMSTRDYQPLTTKQTAQSDESGRGTGVRADIVPTTCAPLPGGAADIDLAEEAVNLQIAKTAYQASAKTIKAATDMQDELLSMFDKRT